MTVSADVNGVATGTFTIPADVTAGTKNVVFTGAGGSGATAVFLGQGTLIEDVRQVVTQVTTTMWMDPPIFVQQDFVDPIAQTFTLEKPIQLEGVDLWFTAVGSTTVSVQIRETQVGYPTRTILADARLNPSQITANQWTRFSFQLPTRLSADVEYAIVALCNDDVSSVAVAELGKFNPANQQWVTTQPYTVGVLLNSSNASTWTAFQDRDLAFRLSARSYTEFERVVDMGSVTLSNATELLVMPMIESPASTSVGELELSLPDGSVVKAGNGQRVAFTAETSGTVGIKARLRAGQFSSSVIYPGTQIVQGRALASSDYVTRAIDADATGCTVKIIYDAVIPSGAAVVAEVSGIDAGDAWLAVTPVGIPKLVDGDLGLYEYQFQRLAVSEAKIRVRLTLSGSASARPRVRNLRVIVL